MSNLWVIFYPRTRQSITAANRICRAGVGPVDPDYNTNFTDGDPGSHSIFIFNPRKPVMAQISKKGR
jgi:hypothetical protein